MEKRQVPIWIKQIEIYYAAADSKVIVGTKTHTRVTIKMKKVQRTEDERHRNQIKHVKYNSVKRLDWRRLPW